MLGLLGALVGMTLAVAPLPAEAEATDAPARLEADALHGRLAAFVKSLWADAKAAGVASATFEQAFAGLEPDPSILDLLTNQPEHAFAPWDYLGRLVSEKRIAAGRQKLNEHGQTLGEVERKLGVDRHVVAAIWGIESNFGALPGTRSVVRSLATLAVADGRRAAFWRTELITALRILQRGDVKLANMSGSWAGAMGHTQFMPTSYMAHAIDFDGDGRRDIWQSVPDALGSTASYLKGSGWQNGEPWGLEVVLPAGFDHGAASPGTTRTAAEWQQAGVSEPPGRAWPDGLKRAALLLPAGQHGPAFLVTDNFAAILRYNNSVSYALAVGHLADRLAGREPIAALWPIDDPPLAKPARSELQQRLTALGFDAGPADGVIGEKTRGAIRSWQRRHGLAEDGWPGTRLMEALKTGAAAKPFP